MSGTRVQVDDGRSVSILIVTHNRRDDVEKCLESIICQPADHLLEVLVLDNGSTDGTLDLVSSYPNIHLTRWGKNHGLAPALKYLANVSKGEWLLFLDSDTILQPGSVDNLLRFAVGNSSIGAVAPRMRDLSGQIQMTARNFPGPVNSLFGRQTLLSRIWAGNPLTCRFLKVEEQEANRPFPCDWVAFAAVLVRRKALIEAGSIDPDFFVYWVDADFFRRLKGAGWEVWCCPGIEVIHMEQNRMKRVRNPRAIRDFHYGAFRYYFKHHGLGGLNPLLSIAALGLCARAGVHLLVNCYRKAQWEQ